MRGRALSCAEQRFVEFAGAGEIAKSTSPLMIREHLVLLLAQGCRSAPRVRSAQDGGIADQGEMHHRMHSWRPGPIPHQYRIVTQLQHAARGSRARLML